MDHLITDPHLVVMPAKIRGDKGANDSSRPAPIGADGHGARKQRFDRARHAVPGRKIGLSVVCLKVTVFRENEGVEL